MQTKNLFRMLWLLFCTTGFAGCSTDDNGFRSFMHTATIMGDSTNGYYCYLDGGGLVISYDAGLKGIERGYFAFNYREEDWKTTADHFMYIDHARISPCSVYEVVHPITMEEAERRHITDKDSCLTPPFLSLDYGYRGYFDFNTGLSIVNLVNGEKVPAQINIVYDPAKQTPDTLFLKFCYNPRIPDEWSKTAFDYSSMSCDISSFATHGPWNDSVTIVVEAGDEKLHLPKIGKNDFLKPEIKIGQP